MIATRVLILLRPGVSFVQVYMLQPAIFSAAGLAALAPAIVDGNALGSTCGSFGITHDVALGILSWMHGLRWLVKAPGGSIHGEMAGGFNVTICESKGVARCWEQGFGGRLQALRATPHKFILHGVKTPDQYEALHALLHEPAMLDCLGPVVHGPEGVPTGKLRFSAAQQPPIVPIEGYSATAHAARHLNEIFSRLPVSLRPGHAGGSSVTRSIPGGPQGATWASTVAAKTEATTGLHIPPVGTKPWALWPTFGPGDCNDGRPFVETAWDQHLVRLRSLSQHHPPRRGQ